MSTGGNCSGALVGFNERCLKRICNSERKKFVLLLRHHIHCAVVYLYLTSNISWRNMNGVIRYKKRFWYCE